MKLRDIFQKKTDIERKIAARKGALLNAERALTLCDKLEQELPAKIAAIESQPVSIHFSVFSAAEDFAGRGDLTAQIRQLKAAREMLKDLPAVRAHWGKVRESLAA